MTTTAHEDQYLSAPEPVREPMSREAILRRNIADMEVALRTQTERAESYSDALRSLASYVGAGGYNADTVDAGVFEEKIRWGIDEIQDRLAGAIERELVARTSLIEARNDIQSWIDSRNEWMNRAEAAEAELKELAQQKPVAWMLECQQWTGDTAWLLSWSQSGAGQCNRIEGNSHQRALYAAPVPAPAVPDERRKFVGFLAQQTTFPHPAVCICQACTWIKKARALLQSAEVPK